MDHTGVSHERTEIYAKKILAGDVESVRMRIISAMELLGYDIIEDEPNIIGRRDERGWANWFFSADVLEYASSLTVRLKAVGENSTRVVFDYSIKHPMLNKGERKIVVKEAETIAAISKTHAIEKICSVCETESTDDSKFCRRCGTPLTTEQAELEVLRMMAETRAGKTSVVASSISMFVSSFVILLAFILNSAGLIKPKLFPVLLIFGGAGVLFSIITSLFGWNRLKRALDTPEEKTPGNASRYKMPFESLDTGEFEELPPQRQPVGSITEGTTNLLDQEWKNRHEKEKVPVSNRRETRDFD